MTKLQKRGIRIWMGMHAATDQKGTEGNYLTINPFEITKRRRSQRQRMHSIISYAPGVFKYSSTLY